MRKRRIKKMIESGGWWGRQKEKYKEEKNKWERGKKIKRNQNKSWNNY